MEKRYKQMSLADIPIPDSSMVEWQVLKDVIVNNDNLPSIYDMVKPEYFTSEDTRRVWDKVVSLFNEGKRYDIVAVGAMDPSVVGKIYSDRLSDTGFLEARQHAQLLRDMAARRRCYTAGLEMLQASTSATGEADVYEMVGKSTAKVQQGEMTGEKSIGAIINEIAESAQKRLEDMKAGRLNRVPTGFSFLDRYFFNGFAPGQLVVISARPSVGKTALMLQFAENAAKNGFKTVLFSLEMTEEELGNRLLLSTDKVDPYALASGELDWPKFEDAAGELSCLPILVNDHSRDLQELVSRMTMLKNSGKLDIAFVDYIGLIESQKDSQTPLYQVIANITGTMKATAKKLRIPIVLLCQLNRDAAKGSDKAPQLHQMRDSGSIEQDADIAMILQQEPKVGEEIPDLLVWVRKNRNGKKDFALVLRPNSTYTNFTETAVKE